MSFKKPIRILVVDDHFVVRIGLLTALNLAPDMCVVGEASTGSQALALYPQHRPDVVLMDLHLPDLNGIETTAALCRAHPQAKVILLTTFDAVEQMPRAFHAGARGFLLKDALGEELFQAIRTVQTGGQHLPSELARSRAPEAPADPGTAPQPPPLPAQRKGRKPSPA